MSDQLDPDTEAFLQVLVDTGAAEDRDAALDLLRRTFNRITPTEGEHHAHH